MSIERDEREQVYATLLLNDDYLPGAIVVAHSLRDGGASRKLAILVPTEGLSHASLTVLARLYDYIIPVQKIYSNNHSNLNLMGRPDLAGAFTKIHLWNQTQFSKIVYLDADTVALRAPEELFDVPHDFSAAPDIGWPDIFNSGVLVLKPDEGVFSSLLTLAQQSLSFDGADQGLLNQFFPHYNRLSFTYNCTPSASYQYAPAYKHFQSQISIAHFIGEEKPWKRGRTTSTHLPYDQLLSRWWASWDRHYRQVDGQYAGRPQDRSGSGIISPQGDIITFPFAPDVRYAARDGPPPPYQAKSGSWNPALSAPPVSSVPEAHNLPASFNNNRWNDSTHHHRQEPAIPAIFPWEFAARAPPTRVWNEVWSPAPAPASLTEPVYESQDHGHEEEEEEEEEEDYTAERQTEEDRIGESSTYETEDDEEVAHSPTTPTEGGAKWGTYDRRNAWDTVEGIHEYVSLLQSRGRSPPKGKKTSNAHDDESDEEERGYAFPITPNPLRNRPVWNSGSRYDKIFPSAPGVPAQGEWDPNAKLDELRQLPEKLLARQQEQRKQQQQAGSPRGSPPRRLSEATTQTPAPIHHATGTQVPRVPMATKGNQTPKKLEATQGHATTVQAGSAK
ncbi:nucleotide-diphospho-sugar transferase [Ascobolus immersus RN42]|uniref:glycogenin glucosyltransferase n=1 Tax=Ascobolus immersus RN42 TaxID=1160509 RepID=A0A3N4IQS8_ASCIM|nr:nucleotide-diphospho-sugar transferase [Ascobolus immersus RN42]